MPENKYFIDDRVIVSEKIRKMTPEERQAEIARLEKIAKAEKEKILSRKNRQP